MEQHIDAIYEDGVLKPLTPLALPDHQRVSVTVRATSIEEEDWIDRAFLIEADSEGDESITIDEVRQALSKVRVPVVDEIRNERDRD